MEGQVTTKLKQEPILWPVPGAAKVLQAGAQGSVGSQRWALSAGESGPTQCWAPEESKLIQLSGKMCPEGHLASSGHRGISAGVKNCREGQAGVPAGRESQGLHLGDGICACVAKPWNSKAVDTASPASPLTVRKAQAS